MIKSNFDMTQLLKENMLNIHDNDFKERSSTLMKFYFNQLWWVIRISDADEIRAWKSQVSFQIV